MRRDSRKKVRRVLILSANPTGTLHLRLDKEAHQILSKQRQSNKRHLFEVEVVPAFTVTDLMRLLEERRPDVVHFCGHGTGTKGIVCDDDTDEMRLIPTDALASLFKQYSGCVRCVILNACSSEVQADKLVEHIDYVVGVKGTLSDAAALAYVEGFYTALFAGEDFPACHELGKAALRLMNIPEHSTPVLRIKQPVKPTNEPTPRVSKKKGDSSKSKPAKVPLRTDEQPRTLGRRDFLRCAMGASAGYAGGWGHRAFLEPTYPLVGFYTQVRSTLPSQLVKDEKGNYTGLTVEAFYCTLAITQEGSEYRIVETTYNVLRLNRLDEIIAGYVSVREWRGPVDGGSTVETTSPKAERHILDELQFKGFARNDADVSAFNAARELLKAQYSYRRASWELHGKELKKKKDSLLPEQTFVRI